MNFRSPKDSPKYRWTIHVAEKMKYYGLSESRVIQAIRNPARVEEGIAEDTVAVMQKAGSSKHPYEIWVMYAASNNRRTSSSKTRFDIMNSQFGRKTVISAWKYPGTSPKGRTIPIPDDIKAELNQFLQNQDIQLS